MNHNSRVVLLKLVLSRALILPLFVVGGPSTTNLPSSIDLLLSFAICSSVSIALSVCPLVTLYRADSGNHGVMQANMNKGAAERPNNQRQPKVGATDNAKTTSKHAPRAQKHYKKIKVIMIGLGGIKKIICNYCHSHPKERHISLSVLLVEIPRTM